MRFRPRWKSPTKPTTLRRLFSAETLEPRLALAGDAVISEFMAVNQSTLQDGDGTYSDWIEIHNPGDAAIDLAGWSLTDDPLDLDQWAFPSVVLEPSGYLIVFASEKSVAPPGELHANFKLSGSGEYLALVRPDGETIATKFDPFPQQVADVAYGLGVSTLETTVVSTSGPVRAIVPTSGTLGLDWTTSAFDDTAWASGNGGVGYDLDSEFDSLIGLDIQAPMLNTNGSAYTRQTFNITNPEDVDGLALDIQYDDGFVAYLNGEEIVSRNASSNDISPPSGLVSYWNFDGNVQDQAANYANNSGVSADNLTPRNGTARYAAGRVGQAIAIGVQAGDATDFTAALSNDVKLPPAYTVEMWVNPSDLTGDWQRLALNWGTTSPEHAYHFAIRNSSGFSNAVSLFHGQTNGVEANANGGTVVANQWQHIAGVADGSMLRVYLNGVQVATAAYDGTIHSVTSEGLGVGDAVSGVLAAFRYNGLLDEMAIWNTPLTSAQLLAHYQAGAAGYSLTPLGGSTEVDWNSTAPADRPDAQAMAIETIDLTSLTGFLQSGQNVLAIQGLNKSTSDRDFLIRAGLRTTQVTLEPTERRYFASATPGAPNGTGSSDLGPIVRVVEHELLPPPGVTQTTLLSANAPVRTFVPTSAALGSQWTNHDYVLGTNGETWASGVGPVGYDTATDYDSLIGADVEGAMRNNNASIYTRSTFTVADPGDISNLKLQVKYDDGFAAYLNGQRVATRNAPANVISPTTGLTTYYSFDNTLADQAPLYSNNVGTTTDTLTATTASGVLNTTYAAGVVGNAVRISRTAGQAAMLTALDANDVDLAADWTLEAWVNPDTTNLNEWRRLATKWFPNTNSWHWSLRGANNGQDLFVNGANVILHSTNTSVPYNAWSHVAMIGNSATNTIKAYLNGVEVASAPYVTVPNGTSPMTLGNFRITDATLQYSGLIDEFAIWRVALTPAQVLAHSQAGSAGYGLTPVGGPTGGLTWNAASTADRPDAQAIVYEEIDLTAFRSALRSGNNVLAIQGLNSSAGDSDFLLATQIVAQSGSNTLQPIRVTAEVLPTINPVASVDLTYRVMFETEQTTQMYDDGSHGDQFALDGIYTATLSGSLADPGEMMRYYVTARDTATTSTRAPTFDDPTGSPQYFGTMIEDPAIASQLPVLHRFIQNEAAAESATGTRASVYYNGEFYDNIFIRIRGGTARGWPKKSYKLAFNDGYHFEFDSTLPRVDEINLNTTYTDKSYTRAILSSELHRESGGVGPITIPVRVEQNGQFFSVAHLVEEPDRDFLRHNGLDPDGALYKAEQNPTNGLTGSASGGSFDKKTRRDEDNSDLQALINGLAQSGTPLETYLFDNVDLPAMVNFMAVGVLLQNIDATDKNYFIYRDTEGDGEWQMLPWDLDLVMGPNALNTDTIVATNDSPPGNTSHPFLGTLAFPYNGRKNHLFDAIVNTPRTREMFLRRVRSLMDEFLNAANTPAAQRYFETRLDELVALLGPDVLLVKAKWGANAAFGGATYTLQQAVDRIKNEYLGPRRTHLFETHSATTGPGTVTTILASGATAKAFVPTSSALNLNWTQRTGFDDSTWLAGTSGVGYDEESTYLGLLGINLRSTAYPAAQRIDVNGDGTSENDSAYMRIPFNVADPNVLTQLKLRMKYDDGFVAYINGVKVAEANAPASPLWNSAATAVHDDGAALAFQDFNIASVGGPGGILVAGTNILAIHILNDATNGVGTSTDMLVMPEIINGTPGAAGSVGIPGLQAGNPGIQFGAVEFNPASGNQDQEYIELVNSNPAAVDISGWKLAGGVEFTFPAGTVIPTGSSLYVAADVADFRSRATGPRGGQRLQVVGGFSGHISNFGETINLLADDGNTVSTITTPSMPSDVQQFLRVTEIMYHPADPTEAETNAGYGDGDLFEFVEFYNTSNSVTLELNQVSFSAGLGFTFGDLSLPPRRYAVIASNAAAFAQRYPGVAIAGEFIGNLSNGGEPLSIDDIDGSSVQDFEYDDNGVGWHPSTDGAGYSLVIINSAGPLASWSAGTSWRPSNAIGGSPGAADAVNVPGDVNGDAHVNLIDLAILQSHFGVVSGATLAQGDLNGDGAITRADAAILARNFGRTGPGLSPAVPLAIVAVKQQTTIQARRRAAGARLDASAVERGSANVVSGDAMSTDAALAELQSGNPLHVRRVRRN